MWKVLREVVFPDVCPSCEGELCASGERLCAECLEKMPLLPERRCPGCGGANDGILSICQDCAGVEGGRPWKVAVSAFPFYGALREAVHKYKYRGRRQFSAFFVKRMCEAWERYGLAGIDAVTYIPLHFLRHLIRGYNQSELLAEGLARHLNVPCASMLRRCRYTRPQASLNMEARLANLIGAYKLRDIRRFVGKHVLLVDDVFTTGTTLTVAAKMLLDAGIAEVSVATVARD